MSDEQGRPASAGGELRHYAFHSTGQNAHVVGLFRVQKNDHDETLTLARFTPDGSWVDDPTLIDDLHDPTVKEIPEHEAHELEQAIGGQGRAAEPQPSTEVDEGPPGLPDGWGYPDHTLRTPETRARWAQSIATSTAISSRFEESGQTDRGWVLMSAHSMFDSDETIEQLKAAQDKHEQPTRRGLIQRILGRAE